MEESKDSTSSLDPFLSKREKRELAKQQKSKELSKSRLKSKIQKAIAYIIIILAIVVGGYKLWQWINAPIAGSQNQQLDALAIRGNDWVKGSSEAKLALIEYGDFECPACAAYSGLLNQLSSDFPNDLAVVFRHFPIPGHKNAVPAAKAAEAAGKQSKFWEMHDLLYEKQDEWVTLANPEGKFVEYAKSLGLNEDKFKADYDSKEVSDRISSDQSEALGLRINATPTFFLNGKKLQGISSYNDFRKIIEDALNN
jgi:protein-disulfide isomerase